MAYKQKIIETIDTQEITVEVQDKAVILTDVEVVLAHHIGPVTDLCQGPYSSPIQTHFKNHVLKNSGTPKIMLLK